MIFYRTNGDLYSIDEATCCYFKLIDAIEHQMEPSLIFILIDQNTQYHINDHLYFIRFTQLKSFRQFGLSYLEVSNTSNNTGFKARNCPIAGSRSDICTPAFSFACLCLIRKFYRKWGTHERFEPFLAHSPA